MYVQCLLTTVRDGTNKYVGNVAEFQYSGISYVQIHFEEYLLPLYSKYLIFLSPIENVNI